MDQSTSLVHAAAATTITIWGVATGLTYEVLLAGFAGGLVSLSYLPSMGIWRRLWTLVTATLTAGYSAPVVGHYLVKQLQSADSVNVSPLALLVFSAFLIGLLAQVLIPKIMKRAGEKVDSYEGPHA